MNENNVLTNITKGEIKTIYEDDYILVLDKPYGIVVNRSKTSASNTVQDYLENNFDFIKNFDVDALRDSNAALDITNPDFLTDEDIEEFTSRSGISHRLDKDTSGVLLISKDAITFKKIKEQFKSRTVQKEYMAVVLGEVKDNKIEIDAPIKRNPSSPLKFAVVSDGKPALTLIDKVKVIQKDEFKFTILKVFPKTGRTHQIRVHLLAMNHPIVGDPIYLTKFNLEMSLRYFSRLMLHSSALTIEHPYLNKVVTYTSELPQEFIDALS